MAETAQRNHRTTVAVRADAARRVATSCAGTVLLLVMALIPTFSATAAVDPATYVRETTVSLPGPGAGVAVDSARGRVFVAGRNEGLLYVLDADTVAGIPTAKFRDRLAGMAATAELSVIAVDPAYTSRWGKQHWLPALSASDPTIDGHRAAAVVIGRRSLGHRARRKPLGPVTRQRTREGQPSRPATTTTKGSRSRVTSKPTAHDATGPPG